MRAKTRHCRYRGIRNEKGESYRKPSNVRRLWRFLVENKLKGERRILTIVTSSERIIEVISQAAKEVTARWNLTMYCFWVV